tara:strand:+ start:70 stop:450 length:381 start_codon:yes stop_codon:yes gene_type:complete
LTKESAFLKSFSRDKLTPYFSITRCLINNSFEAVIYYSPDFRTANSIGFTSSSKEGSFGRICHLPYFAVDRRPAYSTVEVKFELEPDKLDEKLKGIFISLSESCLKLFKAFYYEYKSWEVIARELG